MEKHSKDAQHQNVKINQNHQKMSGPPLSSDEQELWSKFSIPFHLFC